MRRLVLFDVDGTLIERGDLDHLDAIDHGARTVFPESASATVRNVDFDGKVDRLITTEVLLQAGIEIPADDPTLAPVFEHAGEFYRTRWEGKSGGSGDLLPGVEALVEELAGDDAFALGVMTGGSYGIVAVKLERLNLAHAFPVGSYGNEVPARPDLVPLALERAASYYGKAFPPGQVVVVGDTPADVHCAHVHDIACIGVATGKYTEDDLRRAGADVVFPDLSDISCVRDALLTVSLT